jgi:hypothetical protein
MYGPYLHRYGPYTPYTYIHRIYVYMDRIYWYMDCIHRIYGLRNLVISYPHGASLLARGLSQLSQEVRIMHVLHLKAPQSVTTLPRTRCRASVSFPLPTVDIFCIRSEVLCKWVISYPRSGHYSAWIRYYASAPFLSPALGHSFILFLSLL